MRYEVAYHDKKRITEHNTEVGSHLINVFSFQGNFFNQTNEICYGSTVLWKYGHLCVKIRKKYDDDFFVSVLVDHLAYMPIYKFLYIIAHIFTMIFLSFKSFRLLE